MRNEPACGKQRIYNTLKYHLRMITRSAQTMGNELDQWIISCAIRGTYDTIRTQQPVLMGKTRRLRLLANATHTLAENDYSLLLSMRLDFMTESELQFREEASQRLWVGYWRNRREFSDKIKKIEADLAKARKARDEARKLENKANKGKNGRKAFKRLELQG